MKTNIVIMWAIAVFFLAATVFYIWMHYATLDAFDGYGDMGVGYWVGLVTMLLTAIFGAFMAIYLNIRYKNQGGELPEDLDHSQIDDGDPEIGHFSPWSWWPVAVAGSAALVVLGLAVGFWIAFYAIPLLAISLVGHTFEYSRGNHGH